MRFSPLALAALVPLLSVSSPVSAAPPPVCVNTKTVGAWVPDHWWPPLDLPIHTKTDTYIDAGLVKKLDNHNNEMYVTVGDKKATITLYNGHGDNHYFRINFIKSDKTNLYSFVSWGKNGGCVTDPIIVAKDVARITIEMANL